MIFVTPDATSTKVAYPVLCEIRRKRVRATRGEITEEQREVKTRLERAERGRNRGMSDEVKGEGCQRGNVWSVRD